jgi:Ca2+-binding EF-hand superfamily protein
MKMYPARAAVLVLIAGAPFAWGQQQQLSFEYLDTDSNGSLSKEEVAAFATRIPRRPNPDEVFARWDTNKDGQVSKEEFDGRPRGGGGSPPSNR